MRAIAAGPTQDEVFSIEEVARAARVPVDQLREWLAGQAMPAALGFLSRADAVRVVRVFRQDASSERARRPPLTLLPWHKRRAGTSLAVSFAVHGGILALLLTLASFGLFSSPDTEQLVTNALPIRLVYLMKSGPSGGGGGGGLKMSTPPPPAERKAPKPEKRVQSPVPPVRKVATPPPEITPPPQPVVQPQPIEVPHDLPKVEPKVPVPPPAEPRQAIQAPVAPVPNSQKDTVGLPAASPPAPPSNGPGTGGGVGSGSGQGLGEGRGGGIGPGSGGGTGGGPFQPGSGLTPPVLVREVRPSYTDEARRRAIEGSVLLEIVVRQDGTVGNVRVTRSLGAGLDEKAIEAVRQWRFNPARRQSAPVDVVADVSVEFKLR